VALIDSVARKDPAIAFGASGVSSQERPRNATDSKPCGPTIVSVCVTCRMGSTNEGPRVGAMMLDAIAPLVGAQAPDVEVRAVQCLGVCKRPATVAVSAPDGYTFVFGDLEPQTGAEAIVAFVKAYSQVAYGFVPWSARPELLRSRLVARIPAPAWSPADGQPPA
jgi:predicted metal-binding protein